MKTNKFRVWDKHLKKFHTNIKLGEGFWSGNGNAVFCMECKPGDYEECETSFKKNFVFQQFTGLKDKKRKNIYEGDILKCYGEWYDGCKFEYFQVFYNEEEGQYQYLMRGDNIEYGGHPWCEVRHDWYVVGNVFETPELLK